MYREILQRNLCYKVIENSKHKFYFIRGENEGKERILIRVLKIN
jgi:hypothetical protein